MLKEHFTRQEIDDLYKTSHAITELCNLHEYTEPHATGGHSTIHFVKWLVDQKDACIWSYQNPLLYSCGNILLHNDGSCMFYFSISSIDDSFAGMYGPIEDQKKALKRYEIVKKEVQDLYYVPTKPEFEKIAQKAGCYPNYN